MQVAAKLFQFLIGRLVTQAKGGPREAGAQFQFLIGRLVTAGQCLDGVGHVAFQFLIGRLVTPDRLYPLYLLARFNSS